MKFKNFNKALQISPFFYIHTSLERITKNTNKPEGDAIFV